MNIVRVLSLGAGTQSSSLYIRAVDGEFGGERPVAAIFADTQWEPRAVYAHLERLKEYGHSVIPIHTVTKGNIREDALSPRTGFASMPLFTEMPTALVVDGKVKYGKPRIGMLRRQCTREYKIEPVKQAVRRIVLGLAPRKWVPRDTQVEMWLGISTDERKRMKESRTPWMVNRWPLIERNLSRQDCIEHLTAKGFSAAKSACIGCPFHDQAAWQQMREADPESFADAVDFDHRIRRARPKLGSELFLHRSGLPLLEAVRVSGNDEDGFAQECEGMCGI